MIGALARKKKKQKKSCRKMKNHPRNSAFSVPPLSIVPHESHRSYSTTLHQHQQHKRQQHFKAARRGMPHALDIGTFDKRQKTKKQQKKKKEKSKRKSSSKKKSKSQKVKTAKSQRRQSHWAKNKKRKIKRGEQCCTKIQKRNASSHHVVITHFNTKNWLLAPLVMIRESELNVSTAVQTDKTDQSQAASITVDG